MCKSGRTTSRNAYPSWYRPAPWVWFKPPRRRRLFPQQIVVRPRAHQRRAGPAEAPARRGRDGRGLRQRAAGVPADAEAEEAVLLQVGPHPPPGMSAVLSHVSRLVGVGHSEEPGWEWLFPAWLSFLTVRQYALPPVLLLCSLPLAMPCIPSLGRGSVAELVPRG